MRMLSGFSASILVPAIAMVLAPAVHAQQAPGMAQIVRATGESVVQAQPDLVQVDIGVNTESTSAEEAAGQNATKVNRVLAALRNVLGAGASIRTINYSLRPDYSSPMPDGSRPPQRYQANNVVRVETDRLDQVGRVIDVALEAGANVVQSMNFKLRDQSESRDRALREAAQQARSKVDVMAGALGLRVLRVLAVEEGAAVSPIYAERFDVARSSTPIEPGSVEVRATVTVTAEVAAAR